MNLEMKELIAEALGVELKCVICNSYENIQLHHKIPISKGGKNTLSNVEFRCKDHHRPRFDKRKYMREYMREYWKKNPDAYKKQKDRIKKWARAHPDKVKEYNKKSDEKRNERWRNRLMACKTPEERKKILLELA